MGDVQISQVSRFKLDLMGDSPGADSNWYAVSGGSMILHSTNRTTGSDAEQMQEAGDIEYEEVRFVGPMVPAGGARKELLDWLNAWANGEKKRIAATLECLNSEGTVIRTVSYFEAFPTSYTPPGVGVGGKSLEERFSLKAERIEG